MKKISLTLIKICIVLLLIQFIYIPVSNASFWGDIFDDGDEFINVGKNGADVLNDSEVKAEFNKIYNVLFSIGIAFTVIIGAILGIKFMIGSVEEQAKTKEMLMPYVLGCIVIFGSFGIWKLVITLFSKI